MTVYRSESDIIRAGRHGELVSEIEISEISTIEGLRKFVETDSGLINRLISAGNKRLLLANRTYDVGTLDISNISGLEIKGVKKPRYDGTDLVDGTILSGTINSTAATTNCTIANLGITNTTSDGIRLHNGSSFNYIHDVVVKVSQHGILIEDYGNANVDNIVEKCQAYGGIHGFVSKSKGTKFIKCTSDGASTNGFVLCSDNIYGATTFAICTLNLIDGCVAKNTNIGYNVYSRDCFSTTNANGVSNSNNVITNSIADTCASYGVALGDDGTAPTGTTYNQVKNVVLNVVTCVNCATADVLFANCDGVSVNNCNITLYPTVRDMTKAKNVKWGLNNSGYSIADLAYWTSLTVNSATPSVDSGRQYYKTANTAATAINGISGNTKVGQIICITINDGYTSIVRSSSINLLKYQIAGKGSFVILKLNSTGTAWDEIYSNTMNQNQYWAYATDMTIDFDYGNIADSYITGNINSITLSTPKQHGLYYLTLRANGAYTITTWDSRIRWISQLATLSSGNRITLTFLWNGANFIQVAPASTTAI